MFPDTEGFNVQRYRSAHPAEVQLPQSQSPGRAFTRGLLGGLCGLVLGLAPEARAQAGWLIPASFPQPGDLYLSGGFLFSATGRPAGGAVGLGAELSLHFFVPTEKQPSTGVGLFGQWQSINGGEHQRLCVGAQASFVMLGAEFGVTRDFAGRLGAQTTSLHLAPFVAVGLLAIGLRLGIPMEPPSSGRPGYGHDVGLTWRSSCP